MSPRPAKLTAFGQAAGCSKPLRLSVADPNFYFHNGPANTFGLHSHFGEKLNWMLRRALAV